MFLEGDRAFDLIWGTLSGLAALGVAVPLLVWWLPRYRRSVFGSAIDPKYRLQGAYGVFGMAMFGTDFFCRFIPHGFLEYVHPTFALITLLYVAGIAPRLIVLARRGRSVGAARQLAR